MWTFEMERMQDFNWKVCKTFWKNRKIANFKVLKGKDLHIWNVQIWIFKNLLQKFVMECVSQTSEKRKVLKEN